MCWQCWIDLQLTIIGHCTYLLVLDILVSLDVNDILVVVCVDVYDLHLEMVIIISCVTFYNNSMGVDGSDVDSLLDSE